MTSAPASGSPLDPAAAPSAPGRTRAEARTILRPGAVITQAAWPDAPVRSLHVVRIGGAGMSAVARLALEAGIAVSGSDSQDGQFIAPLRAAGARIGIGFDADLLAPDVDVVVVSTAVRADNPEVIEARRRGVPVIHRAAALAGLMGQRTLIAVAGTHGKTSTTAMAALALRGAGQDPAWAVGAAVPDLGRNAGLSEAGGPAAGEQEGLAVVEADESDGSFLAFMPRAVIVTNLEADHLDFHGTPANVTAAFEGLVDRMDPHGALVVCADDPGAADLGDRAEQLLFARVVRYGTGPDCDWRAIAEEPGISGTRVQVASPAGELVLPLSVVGHHNVLNALGALAAASAVLPDADPADLIAGLAPFRGASRRFDLAGTENGIAVYDDYAHHPSEVQAAIAAAIAVAHAQGGRVLAVFQPHLFSRTRDFASEFAAALATADEAWVMPVYAAREDDDPATTARTITQHADGRALPLDAREEVPVRVAASARPGDVVLMLGAGDLVEDTPAVLDAIREAATA